MAEVSAQKEEAQQARERAEEQLQAAEETLRARERELISANDDLSKRLQEASHASGEAAAAELLRAEQARDEAVRSASESRDRIAALARLLEAAPDDLEGKVTGMRAVLSDTQKERDGARDELERVREENARLEAALEQAKSEAKTNSERLQKRIDKQAEVER